MKAGTRVTRTSAWKTTLRERYPWARVDGEGTVREVFAGAVRVEWDGDPVHHFTDARNLEVLEGPQD